MSGPLAGLAVVEVAIGVSELGLGHAGGVPGRLLADLGASVTRVVGPEPLALDAGVPWGRVWHRGKRVVATADTGEVAALLAGADVAFVYGPEALVEDRGLGYEACAAANPGLVYARCRPSVFGGGPDGPVGPVDDYALLVEARAGFCSQLAAHRPGPMLVDVRASGAGAAFLLTTSALALLRRRALTGGGGWAETSLYDGMLATLGCMIGRSERALPKIESYWAKGSFFPNFLYRCGDGELMQIWFGGKGMYAKVIEALGDEPSEEGYYAEQMTGLLNARAERWKDVFVTRPRAEWIERLRSVGVACEPVLGPGEALADPHLAEVGLAVADRSEGHDDVLLGSPIAVTPVPWTDAVDSQPKTSTEGSRLLEGVRVVDFSAFVAGPLAAEVLADLGAEVIKVEPPGGEAMRAAAYAIAACQRGKRSLAMDIGAPEARPVVERLLRGADVVLHNFRVGVSERLGIDEATVARLNPGAVYCHASAFGVSGPRAAYPGNDALMQAVCGFEVANGGAGNDPIAATWIPLDMAGGWLAAAGILAGLYARAAGGGGQRVVTSLLGAGMLLHGGVFLRDGEVVRGPALDGDQTGFGPGYRLYRCAGDTWLALVVPDEAAWAGLRSLPDLAGLPAECALVRPAGSAASAPGAEAVLAAALAGAPAEDWVPRLRAVGARAEVVEDVDRDGFRRRILDDPTNRALGRAVTYETADWGRFEQIGPLFRCGPGVEGGPALHLPGVGEHSVEVLDDLGVPPAETDALLAAKAVHQGDPA
ncbi:MAG TPA: CoA transferase [Acidimicrobiales bacterium]|nr:CoA transferase [Acidimicrobiales bacterium]